MSINLSYINTKHTLQVAKHKTDLRSAIVTKVQEIENHKALKFDNELLIFVCNCIENALDIKMDKKVLALQVMLMVIASGMFHFHLVLMNSLT